jgi:hypothetical protein
MTVLVDGDRQAVNAEFMRELSRLRDVLGAVNKSDLKAAVDATDQWIDDNEGGFNTALPVAARTALTARQKAWLFFFVADKRFEVF